MICRKPERIGLTKETGYCTVQDIQKQLTPRAYKRNRILHSSRHSKAAYPEAIVYAAEIFLSAITHGSPVSFFIGSHS